MHQAHAPGPSVESGQAYQLHAERAEQLMRASRDEQHRLLRSWCRASKTPFVSPGSLTLNRLQVATLARMAGISIGSHGVSHLSLPHQPASVQTLELRESKLVLEQLVGRPVTALAYPFGSHSAETRRLARDAGYDIAVTSEDRATARHEPRLAVSRVDVSTLDARQLRERLEALRQ